MPGFGDVVKKAFYLGVGLAQYAGEQAGGKVAELRSQVQKLAEEMVTRGEMTTEEAKRFVEEMMKQAQQQPPMNASDDIKPPPEPRRIEILEEDEQLTKKDGSTDGDVNTLRDQVRSLQEELKRLQREP